MRRQVWVLAGALVLACAAGLAVFGYVNSTEDRVLAEQQTAQVYVTEQEISAGQTLQDALDQGLIALTQVPAPNVPVGAVTSIDASNSGLIATADLPAGQVVFAQAFSAEIPDASPLRVPEGKAAVTVELADPERVGTFLRPGSQIAVFTTIEDTGKSSTTKLLIDRVGVLAIGPATLPQQSDQDPQSSALVTLAVDQSQAERVIHGAQAGLLYMALLDNSTTFTDSAGYTDASGSLRGTP